jgi:hypothetical protein
MGNPFQKLRDALAAADAEIRRRSPKCKICGKPRGGIIQADQTAETAGLCCCADSATATVETTDAP